MAALSNHFPSRTDPPYIGGEQGVCRIEVCVATRSVHACQRATMGNYNIYFKAVRHCPVNLLV
jgi:hypothetical protein